MEFEDLKAGLWGVAGIGLAMGILFSVMYATENVPLRISVDGVEVYHGRSACVNTESIGSSSRVDVKKGPWCLFPKEYFAGKDVVIKTEGR